ncbi:MAG TPA: macro domain-containing protein [Chthonomonadaceae bacterium]|nr:macro domain-containing protein [Chthonomonadaceae bacterium]
MYDTIKEMLKQPYWVITLLLGAGLVALPCITIDKNNHWTSHSPKTYLLVVIGVLLLILSMASYWFTLLTKPSRDEAGTGLDLTCVKEEKDALWTTVGDCEIRVVEGQIENQQVEEGGAIALPCNEYFDASCVKDKRSALGAYANRVFGGQLDEFATLIETEAQNKLSPGNVQQKTNEELATSYGPGRCLLIPRPLGRSSPIALVSTTTQLAGHGLAARLSYLFKGMNELVAKLADARLNEVVMPVLAGGHGGIHPTLAFVGLLLAIAEAARYRQDGRRLKRVTIVVYRPSVEVLPEVDKVIVRRALALIGSQG